MSVLENIVTIDTFHIWLNRTNEIIDLINENAVLAGPDEGFTVIGNSTIDGILTVNELEANTMISGTLQIGQIFNANTSPISITSSTIFSSSNTENLVDLQTNSANTSPIMRFINNGNARWMLSHANSENTAPFVIKTESAVTPQFSLNQSGQLSANTFSGNGASLTNLNANNISTGTLPLARGGTGGTTAAQARTNLELVPTTSATDSTAGRLLKNGDWAGLLSGSYVMRCTYGGTADAITLTTGAGISGTPPTGMKVRFRATASNTGATTITLDGGAPIACRTINETTALPAGYIRLGCETEAHFNGTHWVLDRQPEYGGTPGDSFLRLANGYMECIRERSINLAISTGLLGGFRSDSSGSAFTAEFVVPPAVTIAPYGYTGLGGTVGNVTTTVAVAQLTAGTSTGVNSRLLTIVSKGLWYTP
jgi:hypothetical protein